MLGIIILCIAAFAVFLALSYAFGLYKTEYDPSKPSHNAVIFLCVAICVAGASVIYYFLAKENFVYPYLRSLKSMNAYEQQFDAFLKGQLNIDIVPDPRLSIMSNPYDKEARTAEGIFYLWDRAYFDGKYYSYFGIAPILIIYYPFYLITKTVPEANTVCYILSVCSVISTAFLVIKLQQIFTKKPNLMLLVLSILACELGGLIFTVQASADMYYIAVASGILFLSLFLLFTFSAYESKKSKIRTVYFALSGVSLVLLVMSRPNLAVYVLLALPVYISTLFGKDFRLSQKICQAAAFAVPTLIGAAGVMWYNYARFGSVFEFGAKYQLTVHDVSEYAVTALLFLPALKYYFFQLPYYMSEAPYFKIPYIPLNSYSSYMYITSTVGAMAFPSNWAVAISPLLINKKADKTKLSVFILSVISVIAVAFFDMCLAGVNIRYLADIALVSVLISTTVIARFISLVSDENRKLKFLCYAFMSALLLLTVTVGLFLVFVNERNNLLNLISE